MVGMLFGFVTELYLWLDHEGAMDLVCGDWDCRYVRSGVRGQLDDERKAFNRKGRKSSHKSRKEYQSHPETRRSPACGKHRRKCFFLVFTMVLSGFSHVLP